MPYVFKDQNDKITGYSKWRFSADQEKVTINDSELMTLIAAQNAEPTNDDIYDSTIKNNKLIKAIVLSLNDVGAFTVDGSKLSGSKLKALIKDKM